MNVKPGLNGEYMFIRVTWLTGCCHLPCNLLLSFLFFTPKPSPTGVCASPWESKLIKPAHVWKLAI